MSLIKFKKIIRKFYYYSNYYLKYSSEKIIKTADENWQKHSISPGDQTIKWIHEKFLNKKKQGYFIELGAYTGVNKSHTYILEKFFDWSGICIEPNDYYYEILKRSRSCICVNECIDGEERMVDFLCYKSTGGIISEDTDNDEKTVDNKSKDNDWQDNKIIKIKTKTLYQILKENNAPSTIDFLSLDVEGAETRILENFPFNKYIFKIMLIEKPSNYLNKIITRNGYKKSDIKSEKNPGEFPLDDIFYVHNSII